MNAPHEMRLKYQAGELGEFEYGEDESRSEGEKKATDNSTPDNVDVIDVGKDIKEEEKDLEIENTDDTNKSKDNMTGWAAWE